MIIFRDFHQMHEHHEINLTVFCLPSQNTLYCIVLNWRLPVPVSSQVPYQQSETLCPIAVRSPDAQTAVMMPIWWWISMA